MGTLANLITGVGTVYTAPFGEPKVEKNDLAPPAITVTPGGNWVATGFTRDGVKILYEPTIEPVFVDQHDGPVKWDKIAERCKVSFVVAEQDVEAWEIAIAACTQSAVAAAADQTAQSIVKVGDDTITPIAMMIVGNSPTADADSIIEFHRVIQTGSPEISMMKTQEGLQVEFDVGCDVTQTAGERFFVKTDITAVASS